MDPCEPAVGDERRRQRTGVTTAEPVVAYTPDWQPLVGPRRADYKNASHFCKAERAFLGEQEFRQKYGNHGGCVSGKR